MTLAKTEHESIVTQVIELNQDEHTAFLWFHWSYLIGTFTIFLIGVGGLWYTKQIVEFIDAPPEHAPWISGIVILTSICWLVIAFINVLVPFHVRNQLLRRHGWDGESRWRIEVHHLPTVDET